MLSTPLAAPFHTLAHRWCDLAERRREHFVELYRSGRWKIYYSEREFLDALRDAIADVDRWSALAGRPVASPDEQQGNEQDRAA